MRLLRARIELIPRHLRRGLFRLFLVFPLSRAVVHPVHLNIDPEGPIVVGAGAFPERVARVGLETLLYVLLKERLVVLAMTILQDFIDLGYET
jgi:hypothetical protein